LDLASDHPNEADELTGDCGDEMGAFFLRASMRRYRAQSRTCAFQAMLRIEDGSAC
jgi:hypothetical protein